MMEYLWQGIRYGIIYGGLAWFGGWAIGKIFKLIRYVAR
jgi:hypothetical protein